MEGSGHSGPRVVGGALVTGGGGRGGGGGGGGGGNGGGGLLSVQYLQAAPAYTSEACESPQWPGATT